MEAIFTMDSFLFSFGFTDFHLIPRDKGMEAKAISAALAGWALLLFLCRPKNYDLVKCIV